MPTETVEAPALAGGTTLAARAAREAEMQPLSKKNEAIMPSMSDIRSQLRLPKKPDPVVEEEQPAPEDEPEDDVLNEELPPEEEPLDEQPTEEPAPEDEEEPAAPEAPKEPVQKRIDQLTAQKSDLQRQLAETQQQLARAQQQPSAADPLGHVATIDDLEAEVASAKQVRALALKNRYGMVVKGANGEDVQYSEEQVADILLNAENTIEAAAVKREQLAGMDADDAALLTAAPHLAESTHPHTAYVEKVLAHQGAEIRRMAASAKMSPRRIAYALALGLNQLSQPAPAALPATRPAASQTPRKAPPAPTPRTAPRAPAGVLQNKVGPQLKQDIARGKPGALERSVSRFLR